MYLSEVEAQLTLLRTQSVLISFTVFIDNPLLCIKPGIIMKIIV